MNLKSSAINVAVRFTERKHLPVLSGVRRHESVLEKRDGSSLRVRTDKTYLLKTDKGGKR